MQALANAYDQFNPEKVNGDERGRLTRATRAAKFDTLIVHHELADNRIKPHCPEETSVIVKMIREPIAHHDL